MPEVWTCAHCGKVQEDGRLWCVLCCEPREDAKPAERVGLSGVAEAHWAAVEKAMEEEA